MSFTDIFKLRNGRVIVTRNLGPDEYFYKPEEHREFDSLDSRYDNLEEFKEAESRGRQAQDEKVVITGSL